MRVACGMENKTWHGCRSGPFHRPSTSVTRRLNRAMCNSIRNARRCRPTRTSSRGALRSVGRLDGEAQRTFLGVRDRAIAALVLATGLRVTAAAELPLAHYDPVTGVVDTVDKRRRRLAHVNATGKRAIRDWLRIRPETESPNQFVQENFAALSKDGVRSLRRRIARKSGVKKGPHIARRTITKRALRAGEDPIKVQLMMGWAGPAMVLRYADEVAQETAAAKLVEYAPI
jgi:site-specific recombinase XerD